MNKRRSKPKAQQIDPADLITIQGTIQRKIFHNEENGWAVLKLTDGTSLTGSMPSVREGEQYSFQGTWVDDPKYGQQFKFVSSEVQLPTGASGLARYLSNVTFGVGMVKAQKIIDALGESCLEIIKQNPDRLKELTFLNDEQRDDIYTDLTANSVCAELAGMICKHGIGMGTVNRIYAAYGKDSVRTVKENPYVLSEDLWGVGFKKADTVAMAIGIPENSPHRVESALMYVLREATSEGHAYLRPNGIIRALIGDKGLIANSGIAVDDIAEANKRLIQQKKCIREGHAIYLMSLYFAEVDVATSVVAQIKKEQRAVKGAQEDATDSERAQADLTHINTLIDEVEAAEGTSCAPEQRSAIKMAIANPFSILTGGPGTGKTFTINAVVKLYQQMFNGEIYLAAPTGRAAKRMSEATGLEAKTIHRLLAYSPREGGFQINGENPLMGPGLLIVDEASMLDLELASALLPAAKDLKVVFVGDIDQLPSVGAGSVLRDLIECGHVPTTRLSYNFRQAGGSVIAARANAIARGEGLSLTSEGDFMHIPVLDAAEAAEKMLECVKAAVAEGRGPLEWQVLLPQRRGSSGVSEMNERIREAINPEFYEVGHVMVGVNKPEYRGYRISDKVMVIKNNYNLGVFNGDIGIVVDVNKTDKRIEVDFVDKRVLFIGEDIGLLTLAYAGTIHKSQGSESPLIIMALTRQHYIMLQRNLLYTGITRAREKLILISDKGSAERAVKNNRVEERFSLLGERIKRALGGGGE